MSLDFSINKILFLVFLYPVVLFFPNIFGYEGFWLTAPYFFLIFLLLTSFLLVARNCELPRKKAFFVLAALLLVSIYNFSSLRYSLPLFFTIYSVVLFVVLSSLKKHEIHPKLPSYILFLYFIISVPFLLTSIGYVHQGRFAGFVGSPTTYSGIIVVLFVTSSLHLKIKSVKFILLFLTTFFLVYLTKTRLLLVFLLIYPFLIELIRKNIWLNRKRLFLIFYGTTLFIYPLYVTVVEWFPNLLRLRYGGKEDTSFGLRNYLFLKSQEEFFSGNATEILFGKGNEHARNFIINLINIDYMPHNDYIRVLIDWGVLGFLFISILLYKMAIKNDYTLFISLTYMVLFYSNMVFNLFIISLLLIFFFKDSKYFSRSNNNFLVNI